MSAPGGNGARDLGALRARAQQFQREHAPAPRKAPAEDGERLATVPRGEGIELRVCWCLYEGKPYVSLREWTRGSDGGWWPTKGRAITVRVRELAGVVAGLVDAMDKVDALPRNDTGAPPGARGSQGRT